MGVTFARWPSTSRYSGDGESAPGGLAFVQDLMNTACFGHPPQPDLLDSIESGQAWMDAALELLRDVDPDTRIEQVELDGLALRQLVSFRSELRAAISRPLGLYADWRRFAEEPASITLGSDGARLHATGQGVAFLRSYVLVQLAVGSIDDRIRRLKLCANPVCRGAFYDRSKNSSRVWHDAATCGNEVNVRAHRKRKRAAETILG